MGGTSSRSDLILCVLDDADDFDRIAQFVAVLPRENAGRWDFVREEFLRHGLVDNGDGGRLWRIVGVEIAPARSDAVPRVSKKPSLTWLKSTMVSSPAFGNVAIDLHILIPEPPLIGVMLESLAERTPGTARRWSSIS